MPEVLTVIDCVVAPLLQTFPVAELEVKTTLPPAQKVVVLPAEMIGVAGNAFTFTAIELEVAEHPFPLVTVTE